jgi:hypothetical protein
MTLSIDDEMTLLELLVTLLVIAITWAVFYGSDRAELPGEATVPDPREPEEISRLPEGRSLR